ncbi:hypothetical protein EVA_05963 [gut metagenome]|uniref:Uncharacterized protein n=1 Tax=gut metagenome TaxID=749906 RepID=J9GYK2_9ZZZZ
MDCLPCLIPNRLGVDKFSILFFHVFPFLAIESPSNIGCLNDCNN